MGEISFIHLSDIHFRKTSGNSYDIDEDLRNAVLTDIKCNLKSSVENVNGFHNSPPVAKSKKLSTKLFGLCSDESIISHRMILNRYSLFCVYFV